MRNFCDSPLWDTNLTWNTPSPDFTPCFQNTVLVWIPSVVLFLLAPFQLRKITTSCDKPIPWGCLNISKLVLNVCLGLLFLVEEIRVVFHYTTSSNVPIADVTAPVIQMITVMIAALLAHYSRLKGLRTSLVLPVFWLAEAVVTILAVRSQALDFSELGDQGQVLPLAIKSAVSLLVTIQFFLSGVVEPARPETDRSQTTCPMKKVSFFSRIFFMWMTRTFLRGLRGEINQSNLHPMCEELKCSTVSKFFEMDNQVKVSLDASRNNLQDLIDERTPLLAPVQRATSVPKRMPLLSILWRICRVNLLLSGLYELMSASLDYVGPFMLNFILNFLTNDEPAWHGLLYALTFYVGSTLMELAAIHSNNLMNVAAIQVRSSLIDTLYKKLFRISSATKRDHTSGEIINLMSVDTEEIFLATTFITNLFIVPVRLLFCMGFLWLYIGPSCMVGLAIVAILSPITAYVARKVDINHDNRMAAKDDRMKIMNEILSGIKVLKLYAWEPPFIRQVEDKRKKELSSLNTLLYWDSTFVFLWSSASMVVALATFAVYLCTDEHRVLSATEAFVSLAAFNLLRLPMGLIPDIIARMVRARVSLRRLQKFLDSEELDPENVGENVKEGDAITIERGTFTWDLDQDAALRNISIRIKKGSLVAVVGPVGSGKTSLLSAILGEMYKKNGMVDIDGSLAYVPQVAWIQNAKLQKNVLFTRDMNPSFYQQVLAACALKPDLEILPSGDQTEIGEKGINLSGGQKQRVSLARAVYQNEDVYLLDDPLSAVDSHVATHLFNQIIGPSGLLRKKTRVLVTHNVAILPQVDYIVVLERGAISDHGTYEDLMKRGEKFALYLQQHLRHDKEHEKEDTKAICKRVLSRELSRISRHSDLSAPEENEEDDEDLGRLTEEERLEKGKIHMRVYLEYFKLSGVALVICSILTAALTCACEVGAGLWLSSWSKDQLLPNGKQDVSLRNERISIYGLLVSGFSIFIVTTALLIWSGGLRASRTVHNNLLCRIMRAPMYFFDSTPVGRILSRFSKDMEDVDIDIPAYFNFWLTSFLWFPAIIIFISLTSAYLLLVLLPLSFIYYYIQKLYIRTTRHLRRMTANFRSPIFSDFSETLAGVSCIRAFDSEGYFMEQCQNRVDTYQNCYYMETAANRWMESSLCLLGGIITLSVALTSAAGRGRLDVGIVGLVLTYCMEITGGLGWLVRMSARLESSVVALERIRGYMETPEEAEWKVVDKQPPLEWPHEGTISIQNWTTAYREGQEPVLRSIHLQILSGQKVAVVGRTGAGKSSLVLSLFRLIEPTEGAIYIDDVNICEVGLHDIRGKLAVIPQDPVIFAGSLRINLDPWNEHSDEEIWLALEYSHLKGFVTELPGSLHFELSEGGENLSAGQRQLVCLTRALLRKTRIIVLDEATASVDLDTDKLIQTTIREAFSHCTVITIAHRLHTVLDYDRVIVLSRGEVIEDGNPALLRREQSSHFYSLAKDAGLT